MCNVDYETRSDCSKHAADRLHTPSTINFTHILANTSNSLLSHTTTLTFTHFIGFSQTCRGLVTSFDYFSFSVNIFEPYLAHQPAESSADLQLLHIASTVDVGQFLEPWTPIVQVIPVQIAVI